MLELEKVQFSYPNEEPTQFEFSLTARPGEITSIVGPSGSGKSTLFDLIAGFQSPQSGKMKLSGQSMLDQFVEQRSVAFLFQRNNLFDHLTARENLALALPNVAGAVQTQAIQRALEQVNLGDYAEQKADQLSGGQQQRVALARTLLLQRRIVLLDEPFTGLDEETRQSSRELVTNLTIENQWITLMITHDHAEAEQLSKTIYQMRAGRLVTI